MPRWEFEMKEHRIQTYLRKLRRQFWLRGVVDEDTLAEIESHLNEAVETGLHQGWTTDETQRKALESFGFIMVVRAFEKERKDKMQKILLVVALGAGLFFAYVDSRPTWDDTGILAGAILITCGLIALIGFQRPWLLALAIGAWIPLRGIFITHNFGSILALMIAFLGAYLGWAVRLGIRKTFDPA